MAVPPYFTKIIGRLKTLGLARSVTLKTRVVTDVFDPDTEEPTISWTDSTIDACIRQVSINSFFNDLTGAEETMRIFTATEIKHLDRITWDSKVFEVQPVEHKEEAGYYTALMKRLVVE